MMSLCMKITLLHLLTTAFLSSIGAFSLHAADSPGMTDYPSLKRITGSEIFFGKTSDFARLKLALSKIEWSGAQGKVKPYESATVEGKLRTLYYKTPENMSTLEVLRNYEQELKGAGFDILHSGLGEEIETEGYNNQIAREILDMTGTYGTPEEKSQWPFQHTNEKDAGYIAAKKVGDTGEIYASVYVVPNTQKDWLGIPIGRTLVRLDVCEVKERTQRMELVQSTEMADKINLNGRVALYGILFDFDKASIRPDSDPTLNEIAKLLQEKPALNILVVGHTDATGSFDYNRSLSQRRAESVVASLVSKGVSSERLFPVGVSFASPVAVNTTEDGRAKNRRVELVDMVGGKK